MGAHGNSVRAMHSIVPVFILVVIFFKTRKNIISMSGVFFVRKFVSVSFNVSLTEGCQLSDRDCGFGSGSPALCILNSDDKTMHVLGGLCLSDDLACVSS